MVVADLVGSIGVGGGGAGVQFPLGWVSFSKLDEWFKVSFSNLVGEGKFICSHLQMIIMQLKISLIIK